MQNKNRSPKPLPEKTSLEKIDQSIQELYAVIKTHRECLFSILVQGEEGRETEIRGYRKQARSRELQLKEALKEAIEVLEESRKAFKSKQLERLRKKLTRVLIDA